MLDFLFFYFYFILFIYLFFWLEEELEVSFSTYFIGHTCWFKVSEYLKK